MRRLVEHTQLHYMQLKNKNDKTIFIRDVLNLKKYIDVSTGKCTKKM